MDLSGAKKVLKFQKVPVFSKFFHKKEILYLRDYLYISYGIMIQFSNAVKKSTKRGKKQIQKKY